MSSSAHLSPHASTRPSATSTPSRLSQVSIVSIGRDPQAESSSRPASGRSRPGSTFSSADVAQQSPHTSDTGSSPSRASRFMHPRKGRDRHSGGFLLGSFRRRKEGGHDDDQDSSKSVAKGKVKGKEAKYLAVDGADKTRKRPSDHAPGNSPLSQQVKPAGQGEHRHSRIDGADDTNGTSNIITHDFQTNGHHDRHSLAPTAAPLLDPTQLVQMALSLSEGRRRHASAGLNATSSTSMDNRRVRSAGAHVFSVAPGSPFGNDSLHPPSSRQTASPNQSYTPSASPRISTTSAHGSPFAAEPSEPSIDEGGEDDETNVEYQFTPGTLARAEKAKIFFELSSHYVALLHHLPPLKPDATASGNYTFVTRNSPGTPAVQVHRVRSGAAGKHDLGREYNPLQLLRNNKTRVRERRPLNPPATSFEDVDQIKGWVQDVQDETNRPTYRAMTDSLPLPSLLADVDIDLPVKAQAPLGHRRTDTSAAKFQRHETSWSFSPAELLADAVWSEQIDNKQFIENRHGRAIFPQAPRQSLDSVASERQSIELDRSGRVLGDTADETELGESELPRGRKKRKLLSMHKVDKGVRKRMSWNRSGSQSSGSDDVSRERRVRNDALDPEQYNVAPLERYMQNVIDQDAAQDSPVVDSPDKWARPPAGHNRHGAVGGESSPRSASDTNGHIRRLKTRRGHSPERPGTSVSHDEGTDGSYERQVTGGSRTQNGSYDDVDTTAQNSPINERFMPTIGMSLSPPASRQQSPSRESSKPHPEKPALLHSTTNARNKIDQLDFASREPVRTISGDMPDGQRSSQESARPSFLARHLTSSSMTTMGKGSRDSLKMSRTVSKEPSSGVSRFFKGRRIGDLVRTESPQSVRGRKADRWEQMSDVSSHESDMSGDEELRLGRLKRPPTNMSSTSLASKASGFSKARSRINLPSFKSTAAAGSQSSLHDPIPRQQKAWREQSQSSQLGRLGPPRIEMTDVSSNVSPLSGRSPVQTPDELHEDAQRDSYGFLTPEYGPRKSARSSVTSLDTSGRLPRRLPVTSLSKADYNSARRPSMNGKRHWSISDRVPQRQETQVTLKDIARVRALFLTSGIKARELRRRADVENHDAAAFLVTAAESANERIAPHKRREEWVMAGQLLSKAVNIMLESSERELNDFRSTTVPGLHGRVDNLRHRVNEKLTPLVHQTADEADAFAAELSTQQTLAVKQVNDAIDLVLRSRRRRLRLVRRFGFAVLEWLVLGLMWLVWFVVVVLRISKGLVLRAVNGVRWVIWA